MTPRLYSPLTAAEYLGISLSTFKRDVDKHLPRLRCGRRVLYRREDLDEFVDRYRPGMDISVDTTAR